MRFFYQYLYLALTLYLALNFTFIFINYGSLDNILFAGFLMLAIIQTYGGMKK